MSSNQSNEKDIENIVVSIDIEKKKSIMGYNPNPLSDFIRITLILPKFVTRCREIFESGRHHFTIPGQPFRQYQTYESNILFALRFLIDK